MVNAPDAADFRELADSLPQLAWMADGQGSIFWYNRRWYDYTGSTPERMLGWGWREVHHPDHVLDVVRRLHAAFASNQPWEDTFPLRGRDGGYRWFLSRAEPSFEADGVTVRRWFGTNTDVTERRELNLGLALNERRFRSLVEATAAIVWSAPADGHFSGEQPGWSAFTGQSEAEYTNWGWLDVIHPDDRPQAAERWAAAMAIGALFSIEYRMRRHDGAWRWMSVRAVPVLDAAGSLIEWVGVHTDVEDSKRAATALQEAKDAAEQANRAKSQFIANMSHELRTPLSAVIGYAEMLEEEVEELGHDHLLEDLRKINSNARHLLSLISDVLDLSKIEANRMTVYAETVDVGELLEQVAATVDSLVAKKANRLVIERQGELGEVHQDQVKIRQCLLNLLGNASKFTENGTITLSARRDVVDGLDWLELAVADSGIGMNEEQLGRLFQRFSQADESTTRRFGGTGLGLAITRGFVALLGGTIAVDSREGLGTTFTLRLPAIYAAQPEAEAAEPTVSGGAAAEVVLVVDDDASVRDLLGRFLAREGFQVHTAADGSKGLALARSLRPRVILLDVMMPRMDGWTVLGAIKADPEIAATPVVMISFVNEPSLAASLGASAYLTKPVEWEALKAVLGGLRANATPHEGEEPRVLVIDDDAGNRERLRGMLARNGFAVETAENGLAGLAAVRRATPSLILLDLMMPQMDGFGFLDALRAEPQFQPIPVVVITAKAIDAEDRRRLDGKIDRLVSKGSVSMRELVGQLRPLLAAGGR